MKIGFRTLKTAIGVTISIWIAHWLNLDSYTAAGILTLLCIQKTRKQSYRAALDRFFACILGLALSSAIFMTLGFVPAVIFLLLILHIPVCVKFGIQAGIPSSSVIMMHTYVHGPVNAPFLLNELVLMVVGLGVALLVNMYMPGIDKKVQYYKEEINRYMAVVLAELAKYVKEGYGLWDGKEMLILADVLNDARNLAMMEVENNLRSGSNPFFHYFDQKQQQYQVLERMLPMVSRMEIQLEQGVRLGEFLEEMSESLRHNRPFDVPYFEQKLRAIREYHKQLPMPETRAEFENRALLYGLANELERFIRK